MDSLPDEILELFFMKLEFHQLLVVREVCLRWQLLIDQSIERRPLWLKKVDENSHYYRFFNVKRIYESKDFNVTYSLLSFRACRAVHSKVRKLIVYNPFVLIGLELDNLIHLEIKNRLPIARTVQAANLIEYLFNHENEEDQPINLQFRSLKTLSFRARSHVDFVIDAGQLQNLEVLCGLQHIQLLDTKSVTNLSVCHYSSELLSFRNVTKLSIDNLDYGDNKKANIIKHFCQLRELIIWDMKADSFDKLIKQKQAAGGERTLKFFYKGVDTDLDQFDFATVNRLNSDTLNETNYQAYVALNGHVKEEFIQNLLIIQKNLNVQMSHFVKFRNVNALLVRTHRLSLPNWQLTKSLSLLQMQFSTFGHWPPRV